MLKSIFNTPTTGVELGDLQGIGVFRGHIGENVNLRVAVFERLGQLDRDPPSRKGFAGFGVGQANRLFVNPVNCQESVDLC